MTATQAKIRTLYKAGLTTVEAIKPHVSCSSRAITDNLARIAKEVAENENLSNLSELGNEAEKILKNHLSKYEGEVKILEKAIKTHENGGKEWRAINKQLCELRDRIEERSGVKLLLKVAEKQAVKNIQESPPAKDAPSIELPEFMKRAKPAIETGGLAE